MDQTDDDLYEKEHESKIDAIEKALKRKVMHPYSVAKEIADEYFPAVGDYAAAMFFAYIIENNGKELDDILTDYCKSPDVILTRKEAKECIYSKRFGSIIEIKGKKVFYNISRILRNHDKNQKSLDLF